MAVTHTRLAGSQKEGSVISGAGPAGVEEGNGEEEEQQDPDLADIVHALSLHVWPASRASLEAATVGADSGCPEPVWCFMRRVLLQYSYPKVGSFLQGVLGVTSHVHLFCQFARSRGGKKASGYKPILMRKKQKGCCKMLFTGEIRCPTKLLFCGHV
eukprot:scaffold88476_cov19-Tisochrysis_lutea.AAC.1